MSGELITPTSHGAIVALDSKALFAADVDAFMDEVWIERERRLREWAAAGWTQQRIADEVGRSQRSVSNWMTRFGIEPSRPTVQPARRVEITSTQPEVVDAELVDDETVEVEEHAAHVRAHSRQQRSDRSPAPTRSYAFVTEVRFQHDAPDQTAAEAWAQRLVERVGRSGAAVCVHRTTRAV